MTATLTRISRAETVRRFRAARFVTMVSRTVRGIDNEPAPRREISRVTSVGVYYRRRNSAGFAAESTRAGTRFAETPNDTWAEDAEGHLILTVRRPEQIFPEHGEPFWTWPVHSVITYRLEES
ncbi:MAG: hypothetical protein K0S37_791 [Microbacterium sp.]|nr:hypothetical protein [Microbacterium sp.]